MAQTSAERNARQRARYWIPENREASLAKDRARYANVLLHKAESQVVLKLACDSREVQSILSTWGR